MQKNTYNFRALTALPILLLIGLGVVLSFPVSVSAQTECIDGIAGSFECANVSLLSHMSLSELGGPTSMVNDNWGWKDSQTGRYYAITGHDDMITFVDVTDPVNPVYLGKMLTTLNQHIARDLKTYENHVFVVAQIPFHGMQVFDLTRLRGVNSPQTFEPDVLYNDIESAHNIAINEESGFAYLVGGTGPWSCGGGLHVVDIRAPKSPLRAACFNGAGKIHDTQCVVYEGPDADYQGAEICFASANGTSLHSLSIIDVSDKNNISLLGQISWPQASIAHQGWLNEDQRYFLMGDEGDEGNFGLNTRTIVLDVGDLDQPVYIGSHLAETTAIDHNQYVKGNHVFQANYSVGLRVLRIDDLGAAKLTEVAWFDTYPTSNSRGVGAWNVYPFFDNGTLLVSDHTTGLFILRANINNEFMINAGHSGAWFYPATSGQGQLIDVEPEEKFMFLSWFTYTDAASANPNEQQWYTAQGNYSGNTANLDLFETLGGKFDAPQAVNTTQVGSATVTFNDCGQGQMAYDFDDGREGAFPMQRVIPGSGITCEEKSGINTEAVDINAGMDGAWFDPNTSGQGFFIDSHPDPEGGDFIFVSWFTYGDDTASGQRWLTAQDSFEGPTAEIEVFETTGGSFDDPKAPNTVKVGTMRIDFTDCSNAQLSYSLTDDGVEGDIAITRVVPGGQALCEELASAE